MATLITSCPECKKQIKIPAEVTGKKIKCKDCGTVFVATSTAVKPDANRPSGDPRGQPGQETFRPVDDEDGDGKPYGVTTLDLTPRCPHCANELEPHDAVVCLTCGYNTQTRELGKRRRIRDTSGGDWFWWLLPAILNVMLFFICFSDLVLILVRLAFREPIEDQLYRNGANCCALWEGVLCLWIMYASAKFAIKRLIFHFHPPEDEIKN